MNKESAERISRSFRGYKHLANLIKKIEQIGSVKVKLGNTGVDFSVTKGDAMYYKLLTSKAALEEELTSYEIIQQTHIGTPTTPTAVISKGQPFSGKAWTDERKAAHSARMKTYWAARRAHTMPKLHA